MNVIEDYIKLLSPFTNGDISADNFTELYNAYYLNDERPFSDKLFYTLDFLFAMVDNYVSDQDLYESNTLDITAEELRQHAQKILENLKNWPEK